MRTTLGLEKLTRRRCERTGKSANSNLGVRRTASGSNSWASWPRSCRTRPGPTSGRLRTPRRLPHSTSPSSERPNSNSRRYFFYSSVSLTLLICFTFIATFRASSWLLFFPLALLVLVLVLGLVLILFLELLVIK